MTSSHSTLPPGSTIGILGGGQLGRMLAMAAARLGLRSCIYCPDSGSPAFDVAAAHMRADYLDEAALGAFAKACDVVTYEFENVPAETVELLSAAVPVLPSTRSLATCQDRLEEKRLVEGLSIGTAPWRAIDDLATLKQAVEEIGERTVLKTRRLGYDGKGQARLDHSTEPEAAWEAVGKAPAILEALVPFAIEVSVVAVRGRDGSFAAYDPIENRHQDGILRTSQVPASVGPETAQRALVIAEEIAKALDHVGVLAVEMFVVRGEGQERLLVNEIAPRVHNTGHWTIEACMADQFEAHIRAVAGWPLPATSRIADAAMENLIGHDADRWAEIAAEHGAALHLYGKAETRAGRKMGHVTRLRER